MKLAHESDTLCSVDGPVEASRGGSRHEGIMEGTNRSGIQSLRIDM